MTQTYTKEAIEALHRVDLPCEKTGFSPPPFDIHIKFLPSPVPGRGWTLLAHAQAGKPDALARWLRPHPGVEEVRVAPGIAPTLLRARVSRLPPAWEALAALVKVHHVVLNPNGHACWFIEGVQDQVWAAMRHLEAAVTAHDADADPAPRVLRCRPVQEPGRETPLSRRQLETLSSAVALGYYEIPHRIDLRTLGARTGVSLGAVSELLRRAESAVVTRYVDANLMGGPFAGPSADPFTHPSADPLRAMEASAVHHAHMA